MVRSRNNMIPKKSTRGSGSSVIRCSFKNNGGLKLLLAATLVAAFAFQICCNCVSFYHPHQPYPLARLAPEGDPWMGPEPPGGPGRRLGRGAAAIAGGGGGIGEGAAVVPGTTTAAASTAAARTVPDRLRFGAPRHSGRLRVLVGVLSADFFNDQVYRKRHRALFQLWNDERVCSLPEFKSKPIGERYVCQLIYTFVIGANPKAPPQLVDGSRPMEVVRPITGLSKDLNEPDMTLLNIRENMNEGKSQTWMHYGAQIAEEYDLDYVAKCDADSMFHLHEFFHFAYKNMPPAPYNSMLYIGALRDKAYWPKHQTEPERIRYESYFGNNFEGVHLYVAGQLYIMSTDLARFIGTEAAKGACTYCEGHEDHDISAVAFHSPEPVKLVVVGRSHRFWEHPVKGEPRWKRIWAREQARVAGLPFEGKLFTTNSTFESVVRDNGAPAAATVVAE